MITVTTNNIQLKASGTTAFTMGQRLEWDVHFLSDGSPVNFENQAVFFNPAMWLESSLPDVNTVIPPTNGYSVQLGTAPEVGFMDIVPIGSNLLWDNIRVEYSLTSSTTLEVKFIFLNSFDLCSYMDNQPINNQPRLLKTSTNEVLAFTNIVDSVYNKEKALKAHLVVADTATQTVRDQVHATYLMENHYFESGVAGGAPEFTGWDFTLERGGVEVLDISTFDTTVLKVQVDIGAGTISPDRQIIIYRDDAAANIAEYENEMRLGVEDSTGPKEGIDYVLASTPWALVAGTVYEATWDLDATKFDYSGSYKFIVVVANVATTVYNSASTKTTIVANALPTPTTGTMTGEILDYNDLYLNDCLQVTAYERIKSCVKVDKASYDTALGAKGLPGDFDTNFQSVRVRLILLDANITDAFDPDNTVVVDVNSEVGDADLEIVNSFNQYSSCLTFRTQPEWANIPFVVIHTYTYAIEEPDNPYEDIIHFRQLYNLNGLEEDTGNTFLTSIVFKDQAGDIVKEICEDFNGPMVVEVAKIATGPDYNLIAAIKLDVVNGDVEEDEAYNNNTLPQLNSSLILNPDITFGGDNLASFEVENDLLELGKKYRIIAIAKEENLTPPTLCPLINIDTDTLVTAIPVIGGNQTADLDINFAVTNFAPSAVTNVDIRTTIDLFFSVPQIDNFVLDTGSYTYTVNWVGLFNNNPVTVIMDIDVTLANGCTYSYTANHVIVPLVGATTQDDADVNAD